MTARSFESRLPVEKAYPGPASRVSELSESVDLTAADASFMIRVPAEGVFPPGDYSLRLKLQPTSGKAPLVQDTQRVTIIP